ncbi:NAD(P)H-dependent FMN reductase [Herbihabitans rhizosphaerae]|uniref:NAD(P)H-dependent FMN reductase n=2 Tax=Herbihabitans rhizosphaerae TaxID=1872711 RepID=A0A4Q7KG62_9PSEU|nr:NAD(P)H-dependent FMN reductase [Herbihabitans rhizosphaerae]
MRLAVILGSVRKSRFGPTAASWFTGQAREHGRFEVDVIDLAENPLPAELPADIHTLGDADGRSDELVALYERLAAADAFVVVTPEYNHSFPASIKHLIDWHYMVWRAKPIGFVSYGGIAGGMRAVEQLRLVFAELHAVTVRDTVGFVNYWEKFDSAGSPVEPEAVNGAAKMMLDELAWWGSVLRNGRAAIPYSPAA